MALYSEWGNNINREHPLQEYPRMQMQRNSYTNINGIWKYQITGVNEKPTQNWKEICVPFALGSPLSGSERILQPDEILWYKKEFKYRPHAEKTLLNFEAVDQVCQIYLNNNEVGKHYGGYDPFTIDVTEFIMEKNVLIVKCMDYTDTSIYAYGKQRLKHAGMWYTPTAGIWQTVWLEDVAKGYIEDIKITPYYDEGEVYIQLEGDFKQAVISIVDNNKVIHKGITNDKTYIYKFDTFHSWSDTDPFLYDLYIQTENDTVKSYFGMRKFSKGKDSQGITRFMLNNKPLFLSGVLDQGYISDGLLTYPDEMAMLYELNTIKEMGFNMLRKHVKVECRRWYYLCDSMGILVMQDMPNGGTEYSKMLTLIKPHLYINKVKDDDYKKFARDEIQSRQMYYKELDRMLLNLYNVVSIFAWVPFNEGWGQFDSAIVTDRIKKFDITRLVDHASGWHDQKSGDFKSDHVYFSHYKAKAPKGDRVLLLSEFGGYSYLEFGHSKAKKPYGYKKFKDKLAMDYAVTELYKKDILENIPKGLSGCVYTQVSDVEDECNGIFTFDRKVIKLDARSLRKMNDKLKKGIK